MAGKGGRRRLPARLSCSRQPFSATSEDRIYIASLNAVPVTLSRFARLGGMTADEITRGHELVEAVREAARTHNRTWEALVPDAFTVNLAAEEAEESAYAAMAVMKRALRDHICQVYGISIRELNSLAMP